MTEVEGCDSYGKDEVINWIMRQRIIVYFFFQAEDGIRDAQESRGLGDVYKRQILTIVLSFESSVQQSDVNAKLKELDETIEKQEQYLSLIHI